MLDEVGYGTDVSIRSLDSEDSNSSWVDVEDEPAEELGLANKDPGPAGQDHLKTPEEQLKQREELLAATEVHVEDLKDNVQAIQAD